MKYVENIHVQNTIRSSLKHPATHTHTKKPNKRSWTVEKKSKAASEEVINRILKFDFLVAKIGPTEQLSIILLQLKRIHQQMFKFVFRWDPDGKRKLPVIKFLGLEPHQFCLG